MTNSKLLFFSIFISMVVHIITIYNLTIKKKDKEIFVINLSEFKEFNFSQPSPPPPIEKEFIKPEPKKKIVKKKVEKPLDKKKTLSIKKIEEEPLKQKLPEPPKPKVVEQTKNPNIKKNPPDKKPIAKPKKQFSLQKNQLAIVNKLLSDYLSFISLEINKVAAKSYPIQSIKRREQGTINSILVIDKNGKLIKIKFEDKSPKRLLNATKQIFKSFVFPKPPSEVLDSNGLLKVKIPVNFILK